MILGWLLYTFIALKFINATEKTGRFEHDVEYILEPITVGKLTGLTSNQCKRCSCGVNRRHTRIVGGWMTEVNEYPWMVALMKKKQFFCGGTLISDRYVTTAAHCVHRKNQNSDWVIQDVRVILSEHNRIIKNETINEICKVSKVIIHPKFSPQTLDSDIALLKLDKPVKFRQEIKPACLPPPKLAGYSNRFPNLDILENSTLICKSYCAMRTINTHTQLMQESTRVGKTLRNTLLMTDNMLFPGSPALFLLALYYVEKTPNQFFYMYLTTQILPETLSLRKKFDGEMGTVTGWGAIKEGGSPSIYLREAIVPIISNAQCTRKGYKPSKITENMLCAGDYRGLDSCQGDSGGPLLLSTSQGQMFTAGIVSWGEGCGRPNKPGVYTRVNKFLDWIIENTKDACYCY